MAIRVIAGKYKGMALDVPSSARPTLSRSKQSLFDSLESLSPYRCDFFRDKLILDCFAGAGSLGFEALSRGSAQVVFIEKDRLAAITIVKNAKKLNATQCCTIITRDLFEVRKIQIKPDVIFIDPPYGKFSIKKILEKLITLQALNVDTIIVIEEEMAAFERENISDTFIEILTKKSSTREYRVIQLAV